MTANSAVIGSHTDYQLPLFAVCMTTNNSDQNSFEIWYLNHSEGRKVWFCIYIQQKCLAPTALVRVVFAWPVCFEGWAVVFLHRAGSLEPWVRSLQAGRLLEDLQVRLLVTLLLFQPFYMSNLKKFYELDSFCSICTLLQLKDFKMQF